MEPMDKSIMEDDPPRQKLTFRVVLVLAGGFFMHVALGQAYSVGNFAPYFMSYIKNRTDDTDLENVDILWFSLVSGSLDWLGLIIGGVLERLVGPRITILIGSVVFSASLAVGYFTIKTSFIVFLIPYATLHTIAGILIYGISIQTAVQWLPHRPSLVTGLVLSGYGGGALVFNQMITQFINPDNISPELIEGDDRYFTDSDLLDRVPYCFLLLGGVSFLMVSIGSLVMVSPSANQQPKKVTTAQNESCQTSITDMSSKVEGDNKTKISKQPEIKIADAEVMNKTTIASQKIDLSTASLKTVVKVVIKTRSLYILMFQVMCAVWSFLCIAFLYKSYAQTFILDDHFLALTGSLASIFNSVGRPMWGLVMDRYGYKVAIRCITIGFSVFCATLFLTEKMHKIFYLIWICFMYLAYCGNWAVFPAVTAKLFTAKNMAFNYGFIFFSVSIASVGVLVTGTTLKAIIGWHGMFFMSAGLGFFPFVLTFFFNGVDNDGKPI